MMMMMAETRRVGTGNFLVLTYTCGGSFKRCCYEPRSNLFPEMRIDSDIPVPTPSYFLLPVIFKAYVAMDSFSYHVETIVLGVRLGCSEKTLVEAGGRLGVHSVPPGQASRRDGGGTSLEDLFPLRTQPAVS